MLAHGWNSLWLRLEGGNYFRMIDRDRRVHRSSSTKSGSEEHHIEVFRRDQPSNQSSGTMVGKLAKQAYWLQPLLNVEKLEKKLTQCLLTQGFEQCLVNNSNSVLFVISTNPADDAWIYFAVSCGLFQSEQNNHDVWHAGVAAIKSKFVLEELNTCPVLSRDWPYSRGNSARTIL